MPHTILDPLDIYFTLIPKFPHRIDISPELKIERAVVLFTVPYFCVTDCGGFLRRLIFGVGWHGPANKCGPDISKSH